MTTDIADGGAGAVIAGQRVELLDRARVYACGITPYDVTHLGHAATFVWIDTLGRVLGLLEAGTGYQRAGGVYFRGAGVAGRAGLDRDAALALSGEFGGRPDDPAKDDPLDVAVWQAAEPGHPAWDSPWGPGRPGWHAECVAMAMSVFGPAVDMHAGGAELRFPHHAYHAA